jgi:hypothetical protein
MRLPDHLYNAVKPLFAHHAPWHNARQPANRSMRGPRTMFPDLKGTDEPGSGEQFLRFHRDMVRLFKWVLANTPGPAYPFSPWDQLPPWLAGLFDATSPTYLPTAYARIEHLVQHGSVDELGNYIEATPLAAAQEASDIHNRCHGTIADYEPRTFGANNERLRDAQMDSFAMAPHNEHFWGLHGWIDNRLAAWQVAHGEAVDQSPLPPSQSGHVHMMDHMAEMPVMPATVMSHEEEVKILRPIWK